MFYIDYELDIIKISFKNPIYKNFTHLYFIPDKNTVYYDNSHLNYIYTENIENITYHFYGFFKNNFFTIIFDSYDKLLNINIKNKLIILIKLDWIIKRYNENSLIWVIDKSKLKNLKYDAIILPIRNKLMNEINIEDYIKIFNYKKIKVTINSIATLEKFNLKKYVKSIWN